MKGEEREFDTWSCHLAVTEEVVPVPMMYSFSLTEPTPRVDPKSASKVTFCKYERPETPVSPIFSFCQVVASSPSNKFRLVPSATSPKLIALAVKLTGFN
jgi:hypothetical protein